MNRLDWIYQMYLRSPHTSECHFNLDWESSKSQENEKPDIYFKKKYILPCNF
jgi:hypothetical protein